MHRVFVLSPAQVTGERAKMVLQPFASFDIARKLRSRAGVTIGELFSFLSGLYFRGKLAYATCFAKPSPGISGAYVMTPSRGLLPAETIVRLNDVQRFADDPIDLQNPRYIRPLKRDAARLARNLGPAGEVVLLGSISTNKYVDVLLQSLGKQLLFPVEFVGRGDMSRGGLMLRCVAQRIELEYRQIDGAVRRGKRPPKLEPMRSS